MMHQAAGLNMYGQIETFGNGNKGTGTKNSAAVMRLKWKFHILIIICIVTILAGIMHANKIGKGDMTVALAVFQVMFNKYRQF